MKRNGIQFAITERTHSWCRTIEDRDSIAAQNPFPSMVTAGALVMHGLQRALVQGEPVVIPVSIGVSAQVGRPAGDADDAYVGALAAFGIDNEKRVGRPAQNVEHLEVLSIRERLFWGSGASGHGA